MSETPIRGTAWPSYDIVTQIVSDADNKPCKCQVDAGDCCCQMQYAKVPVECSDTPLQPFVLSWLWLPDRLTEP